MEEGDTLRTYLAALKRVTKRETLNTVALRRQVAGAAIEQGVYPLGTTPRACAAPRSGPPPSSRRCYWGSSFRTMLWLEAS